MSSSQPTNQNADEQEYKRIWEIYAQSIASMEHFNGTQAEYRKLASTWLLAALGAIGFVLMTLEPARAAQAIGVWFHPLLGAGGLGVLASVGIGLIWQLDMTVYHRLLQAHFYTVIKLEKQYAWLPASHHAMMVLARRVGIEPRVTWFYVIGICLPLVISGGSFSLYLQINGVPPMWGLGISALVIFGVAIWVRMATPTASRDLGELDASITQERLRPL